MPSVTGVAVLIAVLPSVVATRAGILEQMLTPEYPSVFKVYRAPYETDFTGAWAPNGASTADAVPHSVFMDIDGDGAEEYFIVLVRRAGLGYRVVADAPGSHAMITLAQGLGRAAQTVVLRPCPRDKGVDVVESGVPRRFVWSSRLKVYQVQARGRRTMRW